MKTKISFPLAALMALLTGLYSCKKEATVTADHLSVSLESAGAIAISSSSSASTAAKDSIYAVNCFRPHNKRDSVVFSSLPAAIGTYLTANYAGYSFAKAVKITDQQTQAVTYVVVIRVNNNPVALSFTSAGTFASVLEQRVGADLTGKGWHDGGPFCNRDNSHRDTIAPGALPATVKAYFTTNYAADTLLHAFITKDTTYVLVSKNKGLYATGISKAGKLVSRMQISASQGNHSPVTAAALPAAITAYLSATYPGYVFSKAFSESANNTIREYNVFIASNSTNYVVSFSATAGFTKARVIR